MDIERHEESLEKFLVKCYQVPPDGELTRVILTHLGLKPSEIWAGDVATGDFDAEIMARELLEEAWGDCQGIGGMQRYKVGACFADKKRPQRSKRFALDSREEDGGDEESEPANLRGHMAQMMRHNEAMMRNSVMSSSKMLNMALTHLRMKDEQLLRFESRHMDMLELQESLLTRQHDREAESIQLIKSEERKDEIVSAAKLLLPSVVKRISSKLLPESASADGDILKQQLSALGKSLKPEQLPKLMSALGPEQAVVFMEILKTIQQENVKEIKTKPVTGPNNVH